MGGVLAIRDNLREFIVYCGDKSLEKVPDHKTWLKDTQGDYWIMNLDDDDMNCITNADWDDPTYDMHLLMAGPAKGDMIFLCKRYWNKVIVSSVSWPRRIIRPNIARSGKAGDT